jgi:3-phosphoinositide dependent protein kinase-1
MKGRTFDKKKKVFKHKDEIETYEIVGTAEYIAPETLQLKEPDFGIDIWALGCIIYQLLEGRTPFKGKTNLFTFDNIVNKQVTFHSVN